MNRNLVRHAKQCKTTGLFGFNDFEHNFYEGQNIILQRKTNFQWPYNVRKIFDLLRHVAANAR